MRAVWWLACVGCRLNFDVHGDAGGEEAGDSLVTTDVLAADAVVSGPFMNVRIVGPGSISTAATEEEPTFTADGFELVFRRATPGDLYVARRTSVDDPWGPPTVISELMGASADYTPGFSPDGLTLWFASDRAGGMGGTDIWMTTRTDRSSPWTTPTAVTALNSAANEYGPAVSSDGQQITFASNRDGDTDPFIAERVGASWGTPAPIAELVTASADGGVRMWAGGLRVIFQSTRSPGGATDNNLFAAARASTDDPFSAITELTEISSPTNDWDAWPSEDGRYVIFGSDRGGGYDLYEAHR